MNATREMPKYECHKKVWALKIAGIVGDQHGGVYFQPAEEGYDKVPMSPNTWRSTSPRSAVTTWSMRTATSRFHRLALSRADTRHCDG